MIRLLLIIWFSGALVAHAASQPENYRDISDKFSPALFKKIRAFVLENGTPQTYRALDNGNPAFAFTALDVFFGPSGYDAFVLKRFAEEDYYEMTIRDINGQLQQFICLDTYLPGKTFIRKGMNSGRVYWMATEEASVPGTVHPLISQITDEIIQNTAANDPTAFSSFVWIWNATYDATQRLYLPTQTNDTVSFQKNRVYCNNRQIGTFMLDEKAKAIRFTFNEGQPAWCKWPVGDHCSYRFHFNKVESQLYLVPLDENKDLACVEGCTQLFTLLHD